MHVHLARILRICNLQIVLHNLGVPRMCDYLQNGMRSIKCALIMQSIGNMQVDVHIL